MCVHLVHLVHMVIYTAYGYVYVCIREEQLSTKITAVKQDHHWNWQNTFFGESIVIVIKSGCEYTRCGQARNEKWRPRWNLKPAPALRLRRFRQPAGEVRVQRNP